jgi:alanine dehydrogenase
MAKTKPESEPLLSGSGEFLTQEQPLRIKNKGKSLQIGVPREIALQENRLSLTPEGVKILVLNGHEVMVETGAGLTSKFSDREYSDAGARIVYTAKEALEAAVVLKVEPPTLEEITFMKPGSSLVSAIQMGNQTAAYLEALCEKKITAIAYEFIQDKAGGMPVMRAMSEIAGSMIIPIASEYLSDVKHGRGMVIGNITGIPPAQVLILGAGTVAEFAARAALGLGARVRIFDNHIYKLRRIRQIIGHEISTSTLDTINLQTAIAEADLVVGALRAEKGRNRMVVTDEMVSRMKPGSIIIDVSIDQGGCIETSTITSHERPTFVKHDIIHYGVPNIASRVARTATAVISNIFTPILLDAADEGGIQEFIMSRKWFAKGVYVYKGMLTNEPLAKKFNLRFKDINLLIAARY